MTVELEWNWLYIINASLRLWNASFHIWLHICLLISPKCRWKAARLPKSRSRWRVDIDNLSTSIIAVLTFELNWCLWIRTYPHNESWYSLSSCCFTPILLSKMHFWVRISWLIDILESSPEHPSSVIFPCFFSFIIVPPFSINTIPPSRRCIIEQITMNLWIILHPL